MGDHISATRPCTSMKVSQTLKIPVCIRLHHHSRHGNNRPVGLWSRPSEAAARRTGEQRTRSSPPPPPGQFLPSPPPVALKRSHVRPGHFGQPERSAGKAWNRNGHRCTGNSYNSAALGLAGTLTYLWWAGLELSCFFFSSSEQS